MDQRILFVDDDKAVLNAFSRSMKGHGFEIDLANTPADALDCVKAKPYAVIATDYRMPDVDGFSLLEQLREVQPDATYMLISGECDLDLALKAVNEHALSYVIPKPWDSYELMSLLQRSIEAYWERSAARKMQENRVAATGNLEQHKEKFASVLLKSQNLLTDMLLETLEQRNYETKAHARRVAALAKQLATELKLSPDLVISIEQGALLHDVGNIGVPDAILSKSTPLSPDEWALLKTHPSIGGKLLEGFENLRPAREIVEQHHERFDGSGYPNGLKGEEICLGARIFAVVDTLDAMLSSRPYRSAYSFGAVADHFRSAPKLYDPKILAAFERTPASTWLAIRCEFLD